MAISAQQSYQIHPNPHRPQYQMATEMIDRWGSSMPPSPPRNEIFSGWCSVTMFEADSDGAVLAVLPFGGSFADG